LPQGRRMMSHKWCLERLLLGLCLLVSKQRLLLRLESLLLLRHKSLLGSSRSRLSDRRARTGKHADGPSPRIVEGRPGPSCALVRAMAAIRATTSRALAGGALVDVAALALAAALAAALLGGASRGPGAPTLVATAAAATAVVVAVGGSWVGAEGCCRGAVVLVPVRSAVDGAVT